MTPPWAEAFAREWIAAWNAHDLDRVLAHYTDDFEMHSPFIIRLMNEPTGRLTGKANVRRYWQKALELHPDVHFELKAVHLGASSLAILYRNETGRDVTEILFLNADGLAHRAAAHYPAG